MHKRVDERDVMFSRMSYKKGSKQYEDYYRRNPDKKEIDEFLKSLPGLSSPGLGTYHPLNSSIPDTGFQFLADIKKYAEGEVNPERKTVTADEMTRKLKGFAKFLGADLVGVALMQPDYYYSHRGRNPESYGQEIMPDQFHKYGLVFAVEMNRDMISNAPRLEESIAVVKGYVDAAIIGMWLSYYIRSLGYPTRNHMDGNYLVLAPMIAEAAGLGESGRNSILTTKEFGQRIRLGVVTTDIPLIPDSRQEFGLKDFCSICGKCAKACPSQAIPDGPPQSFDGNLRWKINQEKCFRVWQTVGTDCGICIATCPFSQCVPIELIDKMKGNIDVMKQILDAHNEQYGLRPSIKDEPEWMR